MTRIDKPREQALEILCRAEEGAFADALLEQARQLFDSRDNAFILELVYGTLRNRAFLDWRLNRLSRQPVEETDVRTRNVLRLGAYQLLFLDRVPASAAVNTAAELAKLHGKKQGYVNGLLRNLDRNRREAAAPDADDPVRRLALLYSHPAWLVKRWLARYGVAKTEALLRGNNEPAPLVIRTNTLKTTRDGLKAALLTQGVETRETTYSPAGLELLSGSGLRSPAAYEEGLFMVQDEAAQLIGLLLAPAAGDAVLDACAAPGGKATHLAELMRNEGSVAALERDAARIGRIRENSTRLGTTILAPVHGDAVRFQGGPFDRILIDAPCSGLGVLRRRPDGRWNKRERDIKERAALQRRILEHCANLLKPGGVLVYATCSVEPEETGEVITSFLAGSAGGFVIDDARQFLPDKASELVDDRGFLRTLLNEQGMDGFFGARLVRTT